MPKVWIDEYMEGTELPVGQLMQAPKEPPITTQVIDFSDNAHHESATFNPLTTFVGWSTDAVCSVIFGTAPVATTSNRRYPAGFVGYHGVPIGNDEPLKLSVIANT